MSYRRKRVSVAFIITVSANLYFRGRNERNGEMSFFVYRLFCTFSRRVVQCFEYFISQRRSEDWKTFPTLRDN